MTCPARWRCPRWTVKCTYWLTATRPSTYSRRDAGTSCRWSSPCRTTGHPGASVSLRADRPRQSRRPGDAVNPDQSHRHVITGRDPDGHRARSSCGGKSTWWTASGAPGGADVGLHDEHRDGPVLVGADPTSGVIGFWQPATPWAFRTATPGGLFWAELNAWHGALADRIFANLFGYRQEQIRDGVDPDYTTWSRGGQMMLDRLQMNEDWAAPETRAHWMLHFAVDPQTGPTRRSIGCWSWAAGWTLIPTTAGGAGSGGVAEPCGARFALIDPTARIVSASDLAAGSARVDDPYDD